MTDFTKKCREMPISFPPRSNKYNGILRYLFYNENESLNISHSSLNYNENYIFSSAPLDKKGSTYFQTYSSTDQDFYSIGFKKRVFITHFSIQPKTFDVPWYPKNWSLYGCFEGDCSVIGKEPYDDSLNVLRIKRFPVVPGFYDNITFYAFSSVRTFWTINFLDVFGFICDGGLDCNGDLLVRRCTLRCRHYISFSIIFVVLLLSK